MGRLEEEGGRGRFPKPRVGISQCLGFESCRWNGERMEEPRIASLRPWVEFLPVCPECAMGLGVPREPIRLVGEERKKVRLIQPATGRDLTDRMKEFASSFLDRIPEIDGFILKGKSPSCGLRKVKIYKHPFDEQPMGFGRGLFASAVEARLPGLSIEAEDLSDPLYRDRFYTQIWTLARFREVKDLPEEGTIKAFLRFHREHRDLVGVYSRRILRLLDSLVANRGDPWNKVVARYEKELQSVFQRAPRLSSHLRVLKRAVACLSTHLHPKEVRQLHALIHRSSSDFSFLPRCRRQIHALAQRDSIASLLDPVYFAPYPEALIEEEEVRNEKGSST